MQQPARHQGVGDAPPADRMDLAGRDSDRLELLHQLLGAEKLRDRGDRTVQVDHVGYAAGIRCIGRPVQRFEHLERDQRLPLAVVADRQVDKAVPGRVNRHGAEEFVGVAAPGQHLVENWR